MFISGKINEFDWDEGNKNKNWLKHKVINSESEEIFFNEPLIISEDLKHSDTEIRYYTLGITDNSRLLFAVFTVRETKIRIISVRDMNKNEKEIYYAAKEKNT